MLLLNDSQKFSDTMDSFQLILFQCRLSLKQGTVDDTKINKYRSLSLKSLQSGWGLDTHIWSNTISIIYPYMKHILLVKNCLQCRRCKRCNSNSWVRKVLWTRKRQPIPVFLPGKCHGQRSLEGYSSWRHKNLDTTELLTHHTRTHLMISLWNNWNRWKYKC